MADAIVGVCAMLCVCFFFFCYGFQKPIADYIYACAEIKRSQEKRFKLIEKLIEKKLKEENHDAD